MLSSANFSGLSSMHNFATGRASGVHWGMPISILETTSQTPYWFNFHQRDIGHFLVTGPTGSGKTVVLTFLLAQAFRISSRTARPSSSTRIAAPRFSSVPLAATTRCCSPASDRLQSAAAGEQLRPIASSCSPAQGHAPARRPAAGFRQEEEDTLERAIGAHLPGAGRSSARLPICRAS